MSYGACFFSVVLYLFFGAGLLPECCPNAARIRRMAEQMPNWPRHKDERLPRLQIPWLCPLLLQNKAAFPKPFWLTSVSESTR